MADQVETPVYTHYSTVDGDICDSIVIQGCSASNITYNQWLSASVLLYPLPGMDFDPIDASYVKLYSDWTTLKYPVEAYYYSARSGNDFPAEITIEDTYQSLNMTGLYNPTIFEDMFLGYQVPNWSNVFSTTNSVNYFRYITLNIGYGGMFSLNTPRELIEGYVSPILLKMNNLPFYMGGINFNPSSIALDQPRTLANGDVGFFTGEGDSSLTAKVIQWMNTDFTIAVADGAYTPDP
jgi:hypothetical protein